MLRAGWDRDRLVQEITSRGVPCFTGSCSEIYLEEAFPADWRPVERHAVARALGETSLMFLVHPGITEAHLQQVGSIVAEVVQSATVPESLHRALPSGFAQAADQLA